MIRSRHTGTVSPVLEISYVCCCATFLISLHVSLLTNSLIIFFLPSWTNFFFSRALFFFTNRSFQLTCHVFSLCGFSLIHGMGSPDEGPRSTQESSQGFVSLRSQLHDLVRAKSDQKKDAEALYFNKGIIQYSFSPGNLIVLYQKKSGKLEPRWRCPFVVLEPEEPGISYRLHQLNGRRIKGTFHGNHLKLFRPRRGYLADPSATPLLTYRTIRKPRIRKVRP